VTWSLHPSVLTTALGENLTRTRPGSKPGWASAMVSTREDDSSGHVDDSDGLDDWWRAPTSRATSTTSPMGTEVGVRSAFWDSNRMAVTFFTMPSR